MTTQYSSGNYQTNGLLSVPAPKEHILCINIFGLSLKFKCQAHCTEVQPICYLKWAKSAFHNLYHTAGVVGVELLIQQKAKCGVLEKPIASSPSQLADPI